MNRTIKGALKVLIAIIILPSCATIVGGSKYLAKVNVSGHPNAKIEYNGVYQGTGEASFKAYRKASNKFEVTIKEDGCETQSKSFSSRKFRGWAFVGTLVTWTGLAVNGAYFPVPFGVIVDGMTGAWWKPDIDEKGIRKISFNRYTYDIQYTGCPSSKSNMNSSGTQKSKAVRLREMKKLLDDGLISQEEYDREKVKILDQ